MRIGNVEAGTGLYLAPMAGVTHAPLREFFTHLSAALTHTEMVSCAGLVRENEKTFGMLRIAPGNLNGEGVSGGQLPPDINVEGTAARIPLKLVMDLVLQACPEIHGNCSDLEFYRYSDLSVYEEDRNF